MTIEHILCVLRQAGQRDSSYPGHFWVEPDGAGQQSVSTLLGMDGSVVQYGLRQLYSRSLSTAAVSQETGLQQDTASLASNFKSMNSLWNFTFNIFEFRLIMYNWK